MMIEIWCRLSQGPLPSPTPFRSFQYLPLTNLSPSPPSSATPRSMTLGHHLIVISTILVFQFRPSNLYCSLFTTIPFTTQLGTTLSKSNPLLLPQHLSRLLFVLFLKFPMAKLRTCKRDNRTPYRITTIPPDETIQRLFNCLDREESYVEIRYSFNFLLAFHPRIRCR
ncbi:hypothetical protein BJ875DRAFT_295704 [Amylocarpus encephaloides]|uniref:Uncharacterized protein n=1 Tax=Amylocarpus encephaloides TaxID=45428 RepID=A0A9P8C5L6_9HELO|nr:hypothetical protein BJ875DRAFT_295704 [Amylocarpus encephaloides]